MAILRAVCPECGAGLKCTDPAGFTIGEALTCPKCETTFKVKAAAAPAKPAAKKPQVVEDDEDDDRPRKKKRRDDDDEDDRPRKKKKRKADAEAGGGYRSSPLRFIILGILVAIMLVLAVLLYFKWKNENANAASPFDVLRSTSAT